MTNDWGVDYGFNNVRMVANKGQLWKLLPNLWYPWSGHSVHSVFQSLREEIYDE